MTGVRACRWRTGRIAWQAADSYQALARSIPGKVSATKRDAGHSPSRTVYGPPPNDNAPVERLEGSGNGASIVAAGLRVIDIDRDDHTGRHGPPPSLAPVHDSAAWMAGFTVPLSYRRHLRRGSSVPDGTPGACREPVSGRKASVRGTVDPMRIDGQRGGRPPLRRASARPYRGRGTRSRHAGHWRVVRRGDRVLGHRQMRHRRVAASMFGSNPDPPSSRRAGVGRWGRPLWSLRAHRVDDCLRQVHPCVVQVEACPGTQSGPYRNAISSGDTISSARRLDTLRYGPARGQGRDKVGPYRKMPAARRGQRTGRYRGARPPACGDR